MHNIYIPGEWYENTVEYMDICTRRISHNGTNGYKIHKFNARLLSHNENNILPPIIYPMIFWLDVSVYVHTGAAGPMETDEDITHHMLAYLWDKEYMDDTFAITLVFQAKYKEYCRAKFATCEPPFYILLE